jgi:phosphoserine/homoserine phosphotransferase
MEGVLTPEIWLAVADKTGIQELRVTTREIPDYDQLMLKRLAVLRKHEVKLTDIQSVADGISPLDGAAEFLAWLRERSQVVILSDTFYEFISSFMKQLAHPTVFCHTLEVDEKGFITNYHLRKRDQKREAVKAFKNIGFRVLAAGDSYNDISMLQEADGGILFRPPSTIQDEFSQFPVTQTYAELKESLSRLGRFVR